MATASGYNEAVNCATSNTHNPNTYPTTQHTLNVDGAVGDDFVCKWTSDSSGHILRLKTYRATSLGNYFNTTTADTDMTYFPYYVLK